MHKGFGFSTALTKVTAIIFFLIIALLLSGRWYLPVALMSVSVMIRDTEHLFMSFLPISVLRFGEMFIQVLCPFL